MYGRFCYGCETGTISRAIKDQLMAVEIWFLRRMLRIYEKKKSNVEVMTAADVQRVLMKTIRQRQLNFLGHHVRSVADGPN